MVVDISSFGFLILFENLFKPRQLYLQPQNSVLSNLRLAS
ncbi:DNA alkylation repair protein [Streptococcus pseudopneumoniae]|nr:DNA alkylation repair protein [Streptococcus pseudopneumoniae]NIB79051.1 DNA alkylation repair protein [Streptococcus pseudopneumoniae]TMR51558.1 DNA alkylation repair protein [Streptococcus pseudopneumoniae]TMR59421.1 DNA alkylation repair protein [Streptococcus pseudopneumoniae]TMR63332.1 DNA alkylation repair protein [Streptococcus pseudopneumoniae]